MDTNSLTSDDFLSIKPSSFGFANLVTVAFVARAIAEGTPKTEAMQKLQESWRERDKPLVDQPSLLGVYPSSVICIPKRKRSPKKKENVKSPPSTVLSLSIPFKKEEKIGELMMLERQDSQECISVDTKVKKIQWAPPKKRFPLDFGCRSEENTRPTKKPRVVEDCGLAPQVEKEIDKPLNDQPPLLNPSPINIPKREIVQPHPKTENGKEDFGIDVKDKITQRACPQKRIRSDIGCATGSPMKRKKEEEEDWGLLQPPDLPQNFKDKIEELKGCELNLVIQKRLQKSDVDQTLYRMSIPITKIRNEFLKSEEKSMLDSRKDKGKKMNGIEVELIEPSCARVSTLILKKWFMRKDNGNTNPIYNLVNSNWYNKVVVGNGLREETVVQLWAFRVKEKLHFALVKVEDASGGGGGRVEDYECRIQ